MTALAAENKHAISIAREIQNTPILVTNETGTIGFRAGAEITIDGKKNGFDADTPIHLPELIAGKDYLVTLDRSGHVVVLPDVACSLYEDAVFAGFHFAPGGNAKACSGGDTTPAINPFSVWDAGFRPVCTDPRGMTWVEMENIRPFWSDIYFLGTDHRDRGTSRFGATIADGSSRPLKVNGEGRTAKLDYPTAVEICAHHGKRLMTAVEFFAAAYGVKERSAAEDEPETCGLDAERTSRFGLMQATGNMWTWGTDGHPDDPRPSFFGGSWINGSDAGSRFARLGYWPEFSRGFVGVRAASDHLNLV